MRCSWTAHGLMDDFQWRRTDGVLRGDGGGLDVGEGLRCVADKCLNFCYYSQLCFWLCAVFVEYLFFATDTLSDISSGLKKRFSNTVRILKYLLTDFLSDTTIYNNKIR